MMNVMDGWMDVLRAAATTGRELDLDASAASGSTRADDSTGKQALNAEELREVLVDPSLRSDPRGLRLIGAHVVGALDLRGVSLSYPVELERCVFSHQPDFSRATLPALSLAGSHVPGLNVEDLRITHGDLNLSFLTTTGEVDASGAMIDGQLDMTGASLTSSAGTALVLDGAHVSGGMILGGGLSTTGSIRALGATIGVQLQMRGAHLSGDEGFSLIMDGARIAGSLALDEGFTAFGQVRAVGATIEGTLEMTGANLVNEADDALNLEGVHVSGPVYLKDGFTTIGAIRLVGATIEGPLIMTAAKLTSGTNHVLHLDRARIAGGLFLNDGFKANGEVRALGVNIGGQLVMTGARLNSGPTPALSLDGAKIADSAFFEGGFTSTGQVRAPGAEIGGSLEMTGANCEGCKLNLEWARISGNLDLSRVSFSEIHAPHASVGGSVRLNGAVLRGPKVQMLLNGERMDFPPHPTLELSLAKVSGNLMLDGLKTNGPIVATGIEVAKQVSAHGAILDFAGEEALMLDRAIIGDSCFLVEGFSSRSQVRAPGAHIGGRLYVQGGCIQGNHDWALNLEGASLGGLVLDTKSLSGGMNASFANLGVLESRGEPPAELAALGWRVQDLGGSLTTVSTNKAWLSTIKEVDFAAQPWHEIAGIFERHGRPSDAKKLRFQAARMTTRKSPFLAKAIRRVYSAFAGYGYYPLLAGAWLLGAAFIAGALTYCFGPNTFNPWLYGAAVVIPSAAAIIPSNWTVTDPLWLAWSLIALKGFGWLQTGILLAGLTGLLKKQ